MSKSNAKSSFQKLPTLTATIRESFAAVYDRFIETGASEVVLLGRDCWPLVPMLRRDGIPTKYFLWSRETRSKEAFTHWANEIKPFSLVVDTGFAGSLFNKIIQREETHVGHYFYLLSSGGAYPGYRDETFEAWREDIIDWEHTPKLINRIKRYNNDGKAIPLESCDDHEERAWEETVDFNCQLLTALGLNDFLVHTYSTFTGVERDERNPLVHEEMEANRIFRSRVCPVETTLEVLDWEYEECNDEEESHDPEERRQAEERSRLLYKIESRLMREVYGKDLDTVIEITTKVLNQLGRHLEGNYFKQFVGINKGKKPSWLYFGQGSEAYSRGMIGGY